MKNFKILFLSLALMTGLFASAQQTSSGGIVVPTGLKVTAAQPVDDRMTVADSLSLIGIPNKYAGLQSYSVADSTMFVYDGVKWKRASGKPSASNLQSVLNSGSSAYGTGILIQSSNDNIAKGSISVGSTGVSIAGQAGGVKISGDTGGVHIMGGGGLTTSNTKKIEGFGNFIEFDGSNTPPNGSVCINGNGGVNLTFNKNQSSALEINAPNNVTVNSALKINDYPIQGTKLAINGGSGEINANRIIVGESSDGTMNIIGSNGIIQGTQLFTKTNPLQYAQIGDILSTVGTVSGTTSGVVNNTPLQELGGVDKRINGIRIGRGAGNIASNISLGEQALNSNIDGAQNLAIGKRALFSNTTGAVNLAIGDQALDVGVSTSYNLAIGSSAMGSFVGGGPTASKSYNIAIGPFAMFNTVSGGNSIGIGMYTLNSMAGTGASNNIAIGGDYVASKSAGNKITTGSFNNIIGQAGTNITTGSYNLIFGREGVLSTGSGNVIIGNSALSGITSTDNNNVIISDNATPSNVAIRKLADNTLLAPTTTNALITADATGKAIITKEYLTANAVTLTQLTDGLSGKADDSDVVKIEGDQDIDGTKKIIGALRVPNATDTDDAVPLGQMNSSIASVVDNFIPLSGTEVSKPITGNLEFDTPNGVIKISRDSGLTIDNGYEFFGYDGGAFTVSNYTPGTEYSYVFNLDGLVGSMYFDKVSNPYAFAQMEDVTNALAPLEEKLDSEVVFLSDINQDIEGIKTFSSSPIVPTATTSTQAINLGQAQSLVQPEALVHYEESSLTTRIITPTANENIYAFTGTVDAEWTLNSATKIGTKVMFRNITGTDIGNNLKVNADIKQNIHDDAPFLYVTDDNGLVELMWNGTQWLFIRSY